MLGLRFPCLAVIVLSLVVPSCGRANEAGEPDGALPSDVVEHATYGAGRALDVYRPADEAALADTVVAVVHGCCGDRRDLASLAEAIADRGAMVVNADVSALGDGGGWPTTYLDVVCVIAWADAHGPDRADRDRLVVLGWSDGALAAAAVALGWSTFADAATARCDAPIPPTGPDLVIGVSGHYGWTGPVPEHLETERAAEWFGAPSSADSVGWTQGNPGWWIFQDNVVRTTDFVLLGTTDDRNTEWFADRLVEHAIPVELTLFEDAGHDALIVPHGNVGGRALEVIEEVLARP